MLLRKFSLVALIAMVIGGFSALTSSDANAQATDTKSATINAVINNPIALTNTGPLDFAAAAPSTGATTIIVLPDDTVDGASTAIGRTGATTAAAFTVSGLALQTYGITLPGSATVNSGADSMTVNGFNHDAGVAPALDGTGAASFNVGGTLNIGANQASGAYSGTFNVTVSYN
jgi:hypothetical protein